MVSVPKNRWKWKWWYPKCYSVEEKAEERALVEACCRRRHGWHQVTTHRITLLYNKLYIFKLDYTLYNFTIQLTVYIYFTIHQTVYVFYALCATYQLHKAYSQLASCKTQHCSTFKSLTTSSSAYMCTTFEANKYNAIITIEYKN